MRKHLAIATLTLAALMSVGIVLAQLPAKDTQQFSPMTLRAPIYVAGRAISFQQSAIFVMPGDSVSVDTREYKSTLARITSDSGKLRHRGDSRWTWTAPDQPGHVAQLVVTTNDDETLATMNVFVLVPATQVSDAKIGDYEIGNYPDPAGIDSPADYSPPQGFVEVTPENRDRLLSPHFRVGQFVAKQEADWPKYIVAGPELYARLEQLLVAVNDNFENTQTLTIMSGYRTPYYNRSIGQVAYSRHVYGDASDVYVDNDGDSMMDDLNCDGRIDKRDAELLASWVDYPDTPGTQFKVDGGIGIYAPAAWRGPFVHVDTRGTRARW